MTDPEKPASADSPPASAPQKTKPDIKPMQAAPNEAPESRIGERITFARNALTLTVEALSRYTRRFDLPEEKGIPATTLLRYERGDSAPGARELRILCTSLNVPPRWLLLGELENAGKDDGEQQLLAALRNYVHAKAHEFRLESGEDLREMFDPHSHGNRQKWLEEAKRPADRPSK